MSDLVKRLRIKAGMIEMGELIAWGSDSALMREAADALEMAAPAVQGEPVEGLRYTFDGALAECPCCGSLDVGGAHDTVHCQSCGLTVTKPGPLQNAIDAWNTRTSRAHPAAPDVQGEPVGEVRFEFGAPSYVYGEICSDAAPRLAPGTKLYAAPQPAQDVAALVEALESLIKGYVGLLEAGMDRITSLGGDCDPVPVMEQNDPWLRDARAALAAHRKQQEGRQ